jgi:hypothetical protein
MSGITSIWTCRDCTRTIQIMNLLNLTPEIQERLLLLPGAASGRQVVTERDLRRVARPIQREG